MVGRACHFRSIDEYWYVLSGEGEIWRRAPTGHESITRLTPGVCLDIPLGTTFQYRCAGGVPLVFTCTALPPWPGDDEAVIVERADPIVQVASLQNVVDRPVRAGVQINFPGFLCSIGFNAARQGIRGFVTASHCTSRSYAFLSRSGPSGPATRPSGPWPTRACSSA